MFDSTFLQIETYQCIPNKAYLYKCKELEIQSCSVYYIFKDIKKKTLSTYQKKKKKKTFKGFSYAVVENDMSLKSNFGLGLPPEATNWQVDEPQYIKNNI